MRFSPPGGRLAGVFLRGIGPLGTVREARQVLRQCAAVRGVAVDIRPQEGGGTNQQPGRADPAKPGPVAENLLRLPQ